MPARAELGVKGLEEMAFRTINVGWSWRRRAAS
jgi:hypothetical protein